MEHSYPFFHFPQQSLQFRTLYKTESPSKRVRTMKSLRIKEQEVILKRISKSFELRNMRNSKKQQRRKSGTEQLSQKQLHIDYQYPNTIVQQQKVISNEQQRTKERKRTLFKRMSSILIKHQTTIRNISNQGDQRNSEIQLIMLQSQQQGNDEQNITKSQEVKKHKLRSSIIESEKPKVVLHISRKSKKPFASIQSYIQILHIFIYTQVKKQHHKQLHKLQIKQIHSQIINEWINLKQSTIEFREVTSNQTYLSSTRNQNDFFSQEQLLIVRYEFLKIKENQYQYWKYLEEIEDFYKLMKYKFLLIQRSLMQRQQQESSLQQRLGFNHPNITELKPLKDYQTQQNSKKPKELEEQPKLSLMDNLNRINNLYKAVSQPRIDAKEINPPQYFYNHKQGCQKPESTTNKAIKENQNIKTFLNNNELSLKDYDWKPTKATSPIDFSVKSPINKVARTDSVLGNKKSNEPGVTFLRGVY